MSRQAPKRPSSPAVDNNPLILQCAWSDGKLRVGDTENGPTPDMMDQTKDADGECKYMQPIPKNSKKELDWLKKLGDSLVKESDPALYKAKGGRIWFSALPDGYRLFEQVQEKRGGKPRTDTYLYGHPGGPRKRYRSPADFTPHMLWLCCNENHSSASCQCRACKPSRTSTGRNTSPPESPVPEKVVPARRIKATSSGSRRGSNTPTPAPSGLSAPPANANSAASTPTPSNVAPMAPTPPVPPPDQAMFAPMATLAPPENPERARDLQYPNINIFRVGEMVWAQTGVHWSIGVVVKAPQPNSVDGYEIQQLHSPLLAQSQSPRAATAQMIRPWVAWSTPPINLPILSAAAESDIEFEQIPWNQATEPQTCEVDASIIKARYVDGSYTLISCIDANNGLYEGAYLGGERIWVGDAVRLKSSALPNLQVAGNEIVVITQIQDLGSGVHTHARSRDTGIFLTGDVYRQTTHPQQIQDPPTLPKAVLQDLAYRTRVTQVNPAVPFSTYTPVATNVEMKLEDVRGRWYPPATLYRIMNGEAEYRLMVQQHRWEEFGGKLNELGNAGQAVIKGWRKFSHRHLAFAHSIPNNIVFQPFQPQPQQQWDQWIRQPEEGRIEDEMGGLALAGRAAPGNVVDLTGESSSGDAAGSTAGAGGAAGEQEDGNEGLEFLEDEPEDDAFMRTMSQDAVSFIGDGGDGFYGGL